jgi:hypothetical protein
MDDYEQQSLSRLASLALKWVIAPTIGGWLLTALSNCAMPPAPPPAHDAAGAPERAGGAEASPGAADPADATAAPPSDDPSATAALSNLLQQTLHPTPGPTP